MTDSMEISTESQAPSTDTSKQPPPIPNSPSPIASTSPPSNTEPQLKPIDSRQILKPVTPSKRSVTERPNQNGKEKPQTQNAFLPKELAHVIATRQRRERAWHARLMICTTAISYKESALENFKEEVEKEEVLAFKAYLRMAIANFAAAENSPAPPQIPSHTRPNKSGGYGSANGKNGLKKVAIATPRAPMGVAAKIRKIYEAQSLPKIPKMTENTWATVARNGQKKARVTPSTTTQVAPVGTKKDKSGIRSPPNKYPSDKRLFVRLPVDHEWRKLSPAGIREVIVKKLSISPTLIGKIKPVHSGFALSPCSSEAWENILKAGKRSLFDRSEARTCN
ncbi:putative eka-like protein [Erysiphe necator]|uniref:Putative eka-like protein n=1 Tax=Uncinula necator TaxID=52586 RepID=A0A0B1P5T5_UNCNE|nr:putative eka-like protein [Erysiphe necator]